MTSAAARAGFALAFFCVALTAAAASDDRETAEAKLREVRAEVAQIVAAQREAEGRREEAGDALRLADEAVQSAGIAASQLADEAAALAVELRHAEDRRAEVAARTVSQRAELGELLRHAYQAGRDQRVRVFLAPGEAARRSRTLAYLGLLEQAQADRLTSLLAELDELATAMAQVAARDVALAKARAAQATEVARLEALRGSRALAIAQIDAQIEQSGERLAHLARDEASLLELIERLSNVFADIPDNLDVERAFADRRGALPAPLPGPRQRSARPGLFIAAAAGTGVKAVGPGRVVFADWMTGYGLMAIIDHGDDYLSIYANCDALLAEVGDWLAPGDPVGQAGRSGGGQASGLYFELRQGRKALNASQWLAR